MPDSMFRLEAAKVDLNDEQVRQAALGERSVLVVGLTERRPGVKSGLNPHVELRVFPKRETRRPLVVLRSTLATMGKALRDLREVIPPVATKVAGQQGATTHLRYHVGSAGGEIEVEGHLALWSYEGRIYSLGATTTPGGVPSRQAFDAMLGSVTVQARQP